MTKTQNYFLSQPHQPFFMLGVVNAIIMMLIFALNYKGILNLQIDNLTFHVYSLVFLVFANVFTGFLFTTFPRFNQTQVIPYEYYTKVFYLNIVSSILFLAGSFLSHTLVVVGMSITFIAQAVIILKLQYIYKTGASPDKTDSFWILSANYFGLFANFLFIVSEFIPSILSSAVNISFYLYLIFLAFSVAQRMIPFFSHSFAQKDDKFIKIVFGLFILKSLFSASSFKIGEIIVDILLGVYMLREFLRWELHPFNSPAILWVLHLALFWLPSAFLLSAITLSAEMFLNTSFYFLNIHLLALGFLTTLLIGFGTRVTLGHSGQSPHADKVATYIFFFIQFVVVARALYSINIAFGWGLNFLFDISFTLWLILFIVWGFRYGKVLMFGSRL
jgi:uncharacterized protein involved in response to NO